MSRFKVQRMIGFLAVLAALGSAVAHVCPTAIAGQRHGLCEGHLCRRLLLVHGAAI